MFDLNTSSLVGGRHPEKPNWFGKIFSGAKKVYNWYEANKETVDSVTGMVRGIFSKEEVPTPDPVSLEDIQQNKLNKKLLHQNKSIVRELNNEERAILDAMKTDQQILSFEDKIIEFDTAVDTQLARVSKEVDDNYRAYQDDRNAIVRVENKLLKNMQRLEDRTV